MADETMTDEQILEGVEHKSFVATSDRTAASLSASGVAAEDVARAAAQAAYEKSSEKTDFSKKMDSVWEYLKKLFRLSLDTKFIATRRDAIILNIPILIPIIALVIGWFIGIFSGSVVVENIFGLNGVGKLYISALTDKDFEVVLLLQMFYVIISLLGNLVIDIAYGIADPRVRVNK